MKHFFVLNFSIWTSLLLGINVQSRSYYCNFAKPSLNLIVSVKSATVTKVNESTQNVMKIVKSKFVTIGTMTREIFLLKNGDDVQITVSASGRDGLSDYFYPYAINYQGNEGGCESVDIDDEGLSVSRVKSLTNSIGEVIVTSWPGEYGNYQGFKAIKDVVLPSGTTWLKLAANENNKKTCTIKKGNRFLPLNKKPGEVFASLSNPVKYVAQVNSGIEEDGFSYHKGEEIVSLSEISEGYCLLEKNGRRYDSGCIMPESKEFHKMKTMNVSKVCMSPLLTERSNLTNNELEIKEKVQQLNLLLISESKSLADDLKTDSSKIEIHSVNGPKPGNYVYAKCEEGHFSWIPTSVMSSDKIHFTEISVDPF